MYFRWLTVLFIMCFVTVDGANNSRVKRQLIINPGKAMSLNFILLVGFQLILPTISLDDDHFFTSSENYSDEEEGRAFGSSNSLDRNILPGSMVVDDSYAEQTDKIIYILSFLKIDSLVCQERVICEMAADMHMYSPISECLLKEIKFNRGPVNNNSAMAHYMNASSLGITSSDAKICEKHYKRCLKPAYKQLNMAVLKVWQFIASKTNIKFSGFRL